MNAESKPTASPMGTVAYSRGYRLSPDDPVSPPPKPEPTVLVSPQTPAPAPVKVEAKPEPKPEPSVPLKDVSALVQAEVEKVLKAQQAVAPPKKEEPAPDKPDSGAQALAAVNKMQRDSKLKDLLDTAKVTDPAMRKLLTDASASIETDKLAEYITANAPKAPAEVPRVVTPDGGPPNGGGPTTDLIGENPMNWPKGTAQRLLDKDGGRELINRCEAFLFKGSNENRYATTRRGARR